MARTAADDERGCYCWLTPPEAGDPPPGFCGWCQVCGRPGHMRHDPGAPVTGAWCDLHFALRCWLHPLAPRGRMVWGLALCGAVVALFLARR